MAKRGPSGRATTIVINKTLSVPGPDFRVNIGGTKLKSMLLDGVEVSANGITFSGKGYGHGVGMSQWGANKLATQGKRPEEIVAYYYNGIVIEKRWE